MLLMLLKLLLLVLLFSLVLLLSCWVVLSSCLECKRRKRGGERKRKERRGGMNGAMCLLMRVRWALESWIFSGAGFARMTTSTYSQYSSSNCTIESTELHFSYIYYAQLGCLFEMKEWTVFQYFLSVNWFTTNALDRAVAFYFSLTLCYKFSRLACFSAAGSLILRFCSRWGVCQPMKTWIEGRIVYDGWPEQSSHYWIIYSKRVRVSISDLGMLHFPRSIVTLMRWIVPK